MAIKYLDAKRIRGSSTAEKTPAYSTTFTQATSDEWTSSTTHLVYDHTNNRITFDCDDNSTDEFIHHDMGAGNISNTTWILRYEMTFNTFNMSDADVNNALIVGCLDNASPSGLVSTGNGITFNIQVSDAAHSIANVLSAVEDDTQGKEDVNNDPFSKDPLPETDTVYYMEIKRVNATTIEQRVYTTSDYSTTQLGTTIQNTESEVEGATGLRYLTIKLNTEVHNSDGYTGYIQNLKFWNGTTTTATDDKATLLTDSLGSSADMTNSGGTQNITGEIGKAWYTGTSGGYTYAGSTNADWAFMNTTDCKWSIAFWCKLASSGNAIADGDLILGTGNGESEISIALRCNGTGGSFGLHLYGSAEVIAAYSPSGYLEEDDNWHHYVVTWDQTIASSNMKIYKDGGTAITGNKVNDSTSTSSPAHVFSLGGGLGNDFKGNFDEVSVWNRVLTSSEVDFLYDNDGGGTAQVTTDMSDLTSLKAYWNLDATSGTYENNFAKSLLPENTIFNETDTYRQYWLQDSEWKSSGVMWDGQLKAYYKFNETTGEVVNVSQSSDSLGTDVNLDITGATYNDTTSPIGYGMSFDGTNDYAQAGSSTTDFNFFQNGTSPKWTICFWGLIPNVDADGVIGTRPNSLSNGLIVRMRTGGSFSTQIANGGGNFMSADGQTGYGDGTWKFFVIQYDHSLASDNLLQLADDTDQYNATKTSTTMSDGDANSALQIARQTNDTNYNAMKISELSIWNRILTRSELTNLYNDGSGRAIY